MIDPPGYLTVAFDLDDTLFDHRGSAAAACRDWCLNVVSPQAADVEAAVERWLELEAEVFELYRSGSITFQDQRRLRIRKFVTDAGDWSDHRADAAFSAYLSLYRSRWTAFADAAPALATLRNSGYRLCIFTNGDGAQQREKIESIGLQSLVDQILISSDLPAAKPDPASFAAVAIAMDTNPANCLMVGDDLAKDVMPALGCGWGARWLNRRPPNEPYSRHDGYNHLPNVRTIHSLLELPDWSAT